MAGKLTATAVKHAKEGRHGDGAGLILDVKAGGRAYWVLRYTCADKRRDMGLGAANGPNAISLADARERCAIARRLAKTGVDPIQQRETEKLASRAEGQGEREKARTFRDVAALYVASHEGAWRNAKHRAQWGSTLLAYAHPHFGDVPIAEVSKGHVTSALKPIWAAKPETASRVRGRIEAVLDYAKAHGWRDGENPAQWKGNLAHVLPRRSKLAPVQHHAALPWSEMGEFMVALRSREGVSAKALEFTILTAARSGEVRGMTWGEVDLGSKVWTVPGARMKGGREHRVPLSQAAMEVLASVMPERADDSLFTFPSPSRRGAALSDMTLTAVLRRMNRNDLTAHGFRSSFRDWCAEMTAYPREVAETALAHTVRDKVEAAYRRGDVLEKRRQLMCDWADFCAHPLAQLPTEPVAHASAHKGA